MDLVTWYTIPLGVSYGIPGYTLRYTKQSEPKVNI